MKCWYDGQIQHVDDIRISPLDHSLLYGIGFFETFRTYDGQVPLWSFHWERLTRALRDYAIRLPYKSDQLRAAVATLYDVYGEDIYIRLNVLAGEEGIGLRPTTYENPHVLLYAKPLVVQQRGTEKDGFVLQTRRNTRESAIRHKSHNYANNVKGRLELTSLRDEEGIFLTEEGYVAEGVTSNVFWTRRGELYTPSLQTGALEGTTRRVLLQLAPKLDIVHHIGQFPVDALQKADEVFVTNAIQELVPLRSLDGQPLKGKEGTIYRRLHEAYVQHLKEEMER